MEWGHEEATQESSRRGPRQIRRLSPERGQKTGHRENGRKGGLVKSRKKRIVARRNARGRRPARRRRKG
jgi:hypothetical protein